MTNLKQKCTSNLGLLTLAEIAMDRPQKEAFENYLIGALSVLVEREIWGKALVSAATCFSRHHSTEQKQIPGATPEAA